MLAFFALHSIDRALGLDGPMWPLLVVGRLGFLVAGLVLSIIALVECGERSGYREVRAA